MVKPVYVFSGFLDSGKTRAIKETLYDPRFNEGERTLIIAFEKGDEEYDQKFLRSTNSIVVYMDRIKDLTKKKMNDLDKTVKPERIFIELNGMEDDKELYQHGFIDKWELAQTLTTIDASTFQMYLTNMKQFIYNHVQFAEVCIFNRADNIDKRYLRNNLKAINQRLEVIFEDKDGNVTNKIEGELFDVSKDLVISDYDYGLWYMDALDNPAKYEGKRITLKLKLCDDLKEYPDAMIMGRQAMVCCAEDIQNIALTCTQLDKSKIETGKFYNLTGIIHCLDDEDGYKTCVLYVEKQEEAATPEVELVMFN